MNSLMYRMKFNVFCTAQPLILLASIPLEWGHCSTIADVPAAATVFPALAAVGDAVVGSLFPVSSMMDWANTTANSTVYQDCVRFHTWYVFFLGFVVPAFIIWKLERQVRIQFLLSEPRDLIWPGGPTEREMAEALTYGQLQQIRFNESHSSDKRMSGVVLIIAAFLWLVVQYSLSLTSSF